MKPENAIEVNNITKTFKIYLDKGRTLKEKSLFSKRRAHEDRVVLNGISFEVKKGEAIGLIGHNGCGKSTTLKMLSKIMYPDSGTIEMRGRVSSLIELGAGFHPDMSGRENIYINASIFGLSKKEIDARLQDIIDFSELQAYIDNPVRTYSSGMYMRLAFAVAINVDADILLIDEILAVGDVAFQAKCFNRLRQIKAEGTTIVIVSHALAQIEQICERSIWIHDGVIKAEGAPCDVDPMYMAFMAEKNTASVSKEIDVSENSIQNKSETSEMPSEEKSKKNQSISVEDGKRWGSGEVLIEKVEVVDENQNIRDTFFNNEKININIHYKRVGQVDQAVVGIAIFRDDKMYLYGTNTLIDTSKMIDLKNEGVITFAMESLALNAGTYLVDLAFHKPDGFNYDFWREACKISLKNKVGEVGLLSINHLWLNS